MNKIVQKYEKMMIEHFEEKVKINAHQSFLLFFDDDRTDDSTAPYRTATYQYWYGTVPYVLSEETFR